MVDKPNPRYDPEFAHRWLAMCCGLNLTRVKFLKLTGYKEPRVNHYQQGQSPPRKVLLKISNVLNIRRLSLWLEHGDLGVFDDYDKPRVEHFDQLPEDELLKRANELGWKQPHGRPRKPTTPQPSE